MFGYLRNIIKTSSNDVSDLRVKAGQLGSYLTLCQTSKVDDN